VRATTVTLDLSSLPTGTFTSGLSVDGFTLTPNLGPSSIPTIVDVDGVYALESSGHVELGADTLLTMNGGGTFTLDSIEVAAVNGYTGNFGIVLANAEAGTLLAAYGDRDCSLSPTVCGGPLTNTFTTESYSGLSNFQNLTTLDLDPINGGDEDAITAITVTFGSSDTSVPEPASIMLLAMGTAATAALRRRRTGQRR
jgi:PEP-CTERM motif